MKTKWVNPDNYPEFGPDVLAFSEGDTIYMFRGRRGESKPYVRKHEEAHIRFGHTAVKGKITPEQYVQDEVDADLAAYIATGAPTSYWGDINGMYYELQETYGLTPRRSAFIIKRAMRRRTVPPKWDRACNRLMEKSRR